MTTGWYVWSSVRVWLIFVSAISMGFGVLVFVTWCCFICISLLMFGLLVCCLGGGRFL